MAPVPGLKALHSRKRDLLLESDVNRQLLRLELNRIRLSVERLRSGVTSGRNLWTWLAPVTGFLLARRFSRNTGLMAKGSLLVSLVGTAWKVWHALRRPESASDSNR